MNYRTVYEVGDTVISGPVPLVTFLIVGAFLFLFGIYLLVSRYRGKSTSMKKRTPIVMVIIGALWLSLSPTVLSIVKEKNEIQDLYDAGHYKTVEGVVKVLREQPQTGDYVGDLIEVGGIPFQINFYSEGNGHNLTIANGGALTGGAQVRIRYMNELILKVEVAI